MRTLAHGERPPTTPRVGGPCPTFFGYQDTHGVAFLGEQAAAPPPPNGQGGGRARGGHTWPTNIKSGLMPARQGTAQGPAAQRGGAKPRAALPPPLQIRAERGGGSAPHLFFVPSLCHRRASLENATFPHMEQKKTPAGALPWRPYFAFFRIEV